jgi:hypothetical protein
MKLYSRGKGGFGLEPGQKEVAQFVSVGQGSCISFQAGLHAQTAENVYIGIIALLGHHVRRRKADSWTCAFVNNLKPQSHKSNFE